MVSSDSVTVPWSHMPHHRVAVADRVSIATRMLRLLLRRNARSEYEPWGTASAREQARAMLGGTMGSREELSSVLSGATRSRRRAHSGSSARPR